MTQPVRSFMGNRVMFNQRKLLFILPIIVLLLSPSLVRGASSILVNSPRANGMGSCVSTLVDPQSAFYNPGALGIFFLDKSFGFTLPTGTNLASKQTLTTWSINYGSSKERKWGNKKQPVIIGYGAAYSYMHYKNNGGSIIDNDKVSALTISFGAQFYLQIGIGYTSKLTKEKNIYYYNSYSEPSLSGPPPSTVHESTKWSHDLGFLLSLPIQSFFENGIIVHRSHPKDWKLNITPSIAYVKADIIYPKFSRFGLSLETELVVDSFSLVSATVSKEKDKAGPFMKQVVNKWGVELGAFEAVFVRFGKIKNVLPSYSSTGRIDTRRNVGQIVKGGTFYANPAVTTFGFGVHPLKVFRLISRKDLLHNVDLSLDFARWNSSSLSYDNTEFFKATITF